MGLGEQLRKGIKQTIVNGLAKVIEGTAFCGYAGKDANGKSIEVHDHRVLGVRGDQNNRLAIVDSVKAVPYDEAVHGRITAWREEGEIVPNMKSPHSHRGESGLVGPYELGR